MRIKKILKLKRYLNTQPKHRKPKRLKESSSNNIKRCKRKKK